MASVDPEVNGIDADTETDASPRSFADAAAFYARLDDFCCQPSENDWTYFQRALDRYQEAPHLLEPYLDALSAKPVSAFKANIVDDSNRAQWFAHYIYWLSKVVSAKLLVRYFPHAASDLSFLLDTISSPAFAEYAWETRYVLLLWLSLVISIPFALARLSTSSSAASISDTVEKIIKTWLAATGKERDATATLAAKYFARKDVGPEAFISFCDWMRTQLQSQDQHEADVFLATGCLQFLCEYSKSLSRTSTSSAVLPDLYAMTALFDPKSASANIPSSPLLRRLRAKYAGRLATCYLPPPVGKTTARVDFEVASEVEVLVSDLLELLSDNGSRVRWTAAKAISRIGAQLPSSYIEQIAEAILSMYADNILHPGQPNEDLSLVSSAAWNGATLCLSSLLRSGVLSSEVTKQCIPWVLRALIFSQRKGAQKIGSGIRDAACYFIWCLARVASARSEYVDQDTIDAIAQRLVVVCCTDEEVSVRRAASAAYQEFAGRLQTVPHGLDVLVLMDAYIVGSRRDAFLSAAPQIASFPAYRASLLSTLPSKAVDHPERDIRQLSGQSLARILQFLNDKAQTTQIIDTQIKLLADVKQSSRAHGSLVLLTELSFLAEDDSTRLKIFGCLATLPKAILSGSSLALLLPVIANLISATLPKCTYLETANIDHANTWRRYIELATKRPESTSHLAAAEIISVTSAKFDTINDLKSALRTLKNSSSLVAQQCVTTILGAFDFSAGSSCHELLAVTIDRLTKLLDKSNKPTYTSIESRANALSSLGRICAKCTTNPAVDADAIVKVLSKGLEDYTIDERGDIGHTVRIVCIARLTDIVLTMKKAEQLKDSFRQHIVAMLLKQSVERSDSVREQAASQLLRLLPLQESSDEIHLDGATLAQWRSMTDVLPFVLSNYHRSTDSRLILVSIVTVVGGTFEVPAAGQSIFSSWLTTLPPTAPFEDTNSVLRLFQDLAEIATTPNTTNRTLIPCLQTVAVVLQDRFWLQELLEMAPQCSEPLRQLQQVSVKSIETSKVSARVQASMRVLIGLAEVPSLMKECLRVLQKLSTTPDIASALEEYSKDSSTHLRRVLTAEGNQH